MIGKANLESVLKHLGFELNLYGVWCKIFSSDIELQVDIKSETLIYPEELKVHVNTTTNFGASENFVVFECIHRLLEKGYHPKHIELECPIKVGHGASGGRLDIWVKDNDGRSLLVIECKTPGREFEGAWKDTLEDGDQLFRYANALDSQTQFVALYTAEWNGVDVVPEYRLISLRDNEEFLETLPKGTLSFKKATTTKERFRAWSQTYKQDYYTRGLFEEEIAAYTIGKAKYSISDLQNVDNAAIQRKYHEFATILRQHNVASHENAFDKLVNLFLAKIVDESENPDELKFYWKGAAYDDVFALIDRLQFLYMRGMKEFLGEDVTYIEQQQIEDAFRLFKKDATKKVILDYFRQLKFFTENHFAFINVHNEKLFHQNAAVLLAIVRMLQDIRLQTQEHNQFLGDLFEGFLDKGVKQSEGQFFTPMPIVRFLISALPLENLVNSSVKPPKVIDYACGSGHFLTEYCHQIFPFVRKKYGVVARQIEDRTIEFSDRTPFIPYYAAVTGVEKEYRLSKVSKVSACMYGHNEIKIVYADALAAHPDVQDGTYQILVANPPYSVKGFLETLSDTDRASYELFDPASDFARNNAIEVFFVERAKQLLAPGGVAAIILPSSILSNTGIYTRMREILLKYFDLIAIAEFGSGTFGKTGTNTATLFLRRKQTTPDLADHYRNRVDAWFANDFANDSEFEDTHLLSAYCTRQGFSLEDYKTLLAGEPNAELLATELFKEYRKVFDGSAEVRRIKRKRITARYTKEQRSTELQRVWLEYMREIEGEKLYYFMLAESSSVPVVLVKSPADKGEIKRFLGYEWSTRKGSEGIKYLYSSTPAAIGDEDTPLAPDVAGLANIETPLFNPQDLEDATKVNSLIRAAFANKTPEVPPSLAPYVSRASVADMLDFSRPTFDKAFKTTVTDTKKEVKSKWPLVEVGKICEFKYGKPLKENDRKGGNFPVYGSNGIVGYHNKPLVKAPFIVVGRKGSAGKLLYSVIDGYPIDTTFYINKTRNNIDLHYLYLALGTLSLETVNNQMGVPGLNRNDAYKLLVPLPPLDIQNAVVAECEAVDAEYAIAQQQIEKAQQEIEKVFTDFGRYKVSRIGEMPIAINDYSINPQEAPNKEFVYIDIDAVENATGVISFSKRITGASAPSRARRLAKSKSVIISTVRPNLKGLSYIEAEIPNTVFSTGFAILRSLDEAKLSGKFLYLCFMHSSDLMEQMEAAMPKGQYPSINRSDINNLQIPVLPRVEQNRIIAEVEKHEATIATARTTIATAPTRKAEILKKYLE